MTQVLLIKEENLMCPPLKIIQCRDWQFTSSTASELEESSATLSRHRSEQNEGVEKHISAKGIVISRSNDL